MEVVSAANDRSHLLRFQQNSSVHELSLACELVDLACEAAAREGAKRITAIELEVGMLAGVMREALVFGFEAACKDTPAENARLDIIPEPARGYCRRCGATCRLDSYAIVCPSCQEPGLEISGGDQLRLRAVIVE